MRNDYTDYLRHGLFNSDGSKKHHKYIERIKIGAKTWKYFYDIGAYNAFKRSKEERAQIKQNRYDREHDTQAYRIRQQKRAYEKAAEAKAADEAAKAADRESKKGDTISHTIDRLKNELGDREKLKKDMSDNPEKYRERYKNAQKKSRSYELKLSKFLIDNPDIVEKVDFNTVKGDVVTFNTWHKTTPELETKIKQLSTICERLNSTQIEIATYYELNRQMNSNMPDRSLSDMAVPLTLVVKVPLKNGGFTYTLYKDATLRPFKDIDLKDRTNDENANSSGTPSRPRPRSRKKSVTNESGLTVYTR